MQGIRREHHHNTDEQVREYVTKALALVADLEVPEDLRAAVFDKACNLYSTKQILVEQVMQGVPNLAVPRGA